MTAYHRAPSASGSALALPVSIVLMQAEPDSWSVELTVDGNLRYITGGKPTRRVAMLAALDWIEREAAQ